MEGTIDTTLRSVILFVLIMAVLRITGKKGLGQSTLTDFVLILIITKAVYNDEGLDAGIGMVIALTLLNYLFEYLVYKFKKLRDLVEGKPTIIIKDGKLDQKCCQKERFTIDDIHRNLRQHGLEKIEEVKLAVIETDGSVSIIPKEK